MRSKKVKFVIFFLLLLIFFLGANFALAKELEISYPPLPPFFNADSPQVFMEKINQGLIPQEQTFALYVKYFYGLFLMISGFIAFGAIFAGGFLYLIAGGNPVRMVSSRQQIVAGFTGLIILLSSYLILTAINPQLAIFFLGAPPIEKCDCSKPPNELSEYCQRTCQAIVQPGEEIPTYIEVPIGRIAEMVIRKSVDAEEVASTTNSKADFLKRKVVELNSLTQRCDCSGSGVSTQCGSGCAGGICVGDPCPDRNRINALINAEIPNVAQDLECWRWQTLAAKLDLENQYINLRLAEDFMRDSISPSISFENFAALQEKKQIKKLKPWSDIDLRTDPLKNIRYKIAPDLSGFDGVEDPITFYIEAKNNQDIINLIENVADPVTPPPPPPGCFGAAECPEGQERPYTTCDGTSCSSIDSCGISSCQTGADCSAGSPTVCPPGQEKPYTVCDGTVCKSIDACGVNQCQNDQSCISHPSPGICDVGTGLCSPNNLVGPNFTWNLIEASQICWAESRGRPAVLNTDCLNNGTCDYSGGLFQMNLLDPCSQGLGYGNVRWVPDRNGLKIMYCQCYVRDQNALNACLSYYGIGDTPEVYNNNVKRAAEKYNYRQNWCAWGTSYGCGLCP